jgi:AcrR family transcriptional regulator
MPRSSPASTRLPRPTRANDALERLLSAADDLFYRKGIRNVGIDEIIATAGVAKASLYAHFASKDELVLEYVRQRSARWFAWFRAQVESRATKASARLLAVFDVLSDAARAPEFRGCALQNAAIELADSTHPAHRAVVAAKQALRDYLVDLATDAGVRQPKAIGQQLAVLVEGVLVSGLIEESAIPARAARAAAVAVLRAA